MIAGAGDHAVQDMILEDAERDLVDRGLDRRDLLQDVDAVAMVVDILEIPRTWPSMRRRRLMSWSFCGV